MAEGSCFICEEPLGESETVTPNKKGLETLIRASQERCDNKYRKHRLQDQQCVTLHQKCRKSYVHIDNINACKRKREAEIPGTSTRSSSTSFDFSQNCLFCGDDASETYVRKNSKKLGTKKRETVHEVVTETLRERILTKAIERSDRWGHEVLNRIAAVTDLVSVNARYHSFCHPRFFALAPDTSQSADDTPKIIELIEEFINENPDVPQFSLKSIVDGYKGKAANNQWLKKKIYEKLGDDIIITSNAGAEPIICLRDTCHKILLKNFKESQDEGPDRQKIVTAAAKIIMEDIRSEKYDVDTYPSPNSFLDDVEKVIPNSLRSFLDTIVLSDKRGEEEGEFLSKIVAIAHAIISCVRPRSFLSCLKIGLGAVLNKKFGSKSLLNILSALGFCCSYDESVLFEASVLSEPNNAVIDAESFSQFVFDNADHNVNTIDGLHTFHAMGGIECVTPTSAVSCDFRIPKLKAIPSRDTIGSFGTISLKTFDCSKKAGLGTVPVENLAMKNPTVKYEFDISSTDFLWVYNQTARCVDLQGWNGFMENSTQGREYQKSRIVCLPFLNHPPSNHDTIYTVLSLAAERIQNKEQNIALVTFDQPLYWKAKEIIHSTPDEKLKTVVVRLGGFHLVMSFLGSIGFIMDGSGLKELFSEIYAPASVEKMLAGHAYSRALRAHILVHCALSQIIIRATNFTDTEASKLSTILDNPGNIFESIDSHVEFKSIKGKFLDSANRLAGNSATAKLWMQYLQMVSLVKMFVEAERSGNWQLHLETIQKMLPFFHSSGHFLYAKSAHLYLQDMYELDKRMEEAEYRKFVNGGFTIRRTDKFWSGIWSDMTVEQVLMRAIKDIGGPTRGRGMTDSVLSKWVLTTPALIDLVESLTEFCNVYLATTEQHVDSRPTRIARDISDTEKILSWFEGHNPFPETDGIISLSTGLKGGKDDNVNCHQALEIGLKCLAEMSKTNDSGVSSSFKDVKYTRKNKVTPLKALVSAVKVSDCTATIDPSLLFQRICVLKKSDAELRLYFNYELAPYPLALFDDKGMRKCPKSKFYDFFTPVQSPDGGRDIYVIDGGHLLHKVVWQQKELFGDILTRYVNYLTKHYSNNCVVVFDGYPEKSEERRTKSAERLRRARVTAAPEVVCDVNMPSTMSQDKFLSNEKNKIHLIDILSNRLQNNGFQVHQAVEDADSLIVDTAISIREKYDSVYVVGEDVDLLVILTQIAHDKNNTYLLKPSRGNVEQKLYSVNSFKYPEIQYLVCFIHAFTGCDTTSAIYNQGKAKLVRLLSNDTNGLRKEAEVFYNPNAVKSSVYAAGQRVMMALYGAKESDNYTYPEFRYLCFTKSTLKSTFNLSCLPPTVEACNEHSLRVYLQVREWQGDHSKDPMQWGWKRSQNLLLPITCRKDPIPPDLLQIISCGCDKSNCTSNCTCRRVGLKCTVLCRKCNGQNCNNVEEPQIILSDDEIDDDLLDFIGDDWPDTEMTSVHNKLKKKKDSDKDVSVPASKKKKRLD